MKKMSIIFILIIIILTIGCSSSIPTETRPANQTDDADPGQIRPTPTTIDQSSEEVNPLVPYPGIPPTATPYPEGYPAPQQFPAIDAYPANENTVWILHPVGLQCEDTSESKYQNEQDVSAGLTAAGIQVYEVTTTDLMVCAACGCPTSAHYRAEIAASDLNKAVSLGWEPE